MTVSCTTPRTVSVAPKIDTLPARNDVAASRLNVPLEKLSMAAIPGKNVAARAASAAGEDDQFAVMA